MSKPRPTAKARRQSAMLDQFAKVAEEVAFVVGIDPASRVTGAAMVAACGTRLIDAVRIHSAKADPAPRIREIAQDLRAWMMNHPWPALSDGRERIALPPTVLIVVESPSPRRSSRTQNQTGGFGLTTYGVAAGYVMSLADQLAADFDRVVLVDERTWNGSQAKGANLARVSALFPEYRAQDDPGADVADAIGLALWGCHQLMLARRAGAA